MSKLYRVSGLHSDILAFAAVLCLVVTPLAAQSQAPQAPPTPQTPPTAGKPAGTEMQAPAKSKPNAPTAPETHITPEQAKQLFGLVDQLIEFSSQETGLPITSEVKRQLTTRTAVEAYLKEKFDDD